MDLFEELSRATTRRQFLGRSTTGIGVVALASLLNQDLFAARDETSLKTEGALPRLHFAPKAKRVIYLFMSGGPSHIDLFDPKPMLEKRTGEELPNSVRGGQRITGMTSGQSKLLMVGAAARFARHGESGAEISTYMPHLGSIADEISIIRS